MRNPITFEEAMGRVEVDGEKVCYEGNPFYIFDHDGMNYCFAADGYSRPIDISKDIPEAAKQMPWYVTDGLVSFDQAMMALNDFGGMVRRKPWGDDRGIQGSTMAMFYQPTEEDRAATDWLVVPQNGVEIGQICNRDGCQGVIHLHDSDGSCSCHINPPCSYCTTDREYCPECDWSAEDDKRAHDAEASRKYREWQASPAGIEAKRKETERQRANEEESRLFREMFSGRMPVDKFRYSVKTLPYYSEEVSAVFTKDDYTADPKFGGMYKKFNSEITRLLDRGFGGRFTHQTDYSFTYIAYTD